MISVVLSYVFLKLINRIKKLTLAKNDTKLEQNLALLDNSVDVTVKR